MELVENLFAGLLTFKRARAYAAIFVLIYVTIYGLQVARGHGLIDGFGHVIGGDLLTLRTAGQMVRDGDGARLYDFGTQAEYQQRAVQPERLPGLNPFVTPPFVAIVYVPLSFLPQGFAFVLWSGISFGAIALSLWLVVGRAGIGQVHWRVGLLFSLSFFPVLEGLMAGNFSAISLLIFTGIYLALKKDRDFLAGGLLGLQLIKPQLVLAFIFILAYKRRWRALVGVGAVGFAWLALDLVVLGSSSIATFLAMLPQVSGFSFVEGFPYYLLSSIYAFFSIPLGANGIGIAMMLGTLSSLVIVGFLIKVWSGPWNSSSARFDVGYAGTLVATCLISPYVQLHDLTILVLAAVLLARYYFANDRLEGSRPGWNLVRLALAFLWLISLIGPLLASWQRIQLVPVGVLVLGWAILTAVATARSEEAAVGRWSIRPFASTDRVT